VRLEIGRTYVAVPDRHLLVNDASIVLARSPKQNGVRPAVDALFRSAARWYGPRTIGVIVSGSLDDGATGLATIDAAGGASIVQTPADAAFPGMPSAALADTPCIGPDREPVGHGDRGPRRKTCRNRHTARTDVGGGDGYGRSRHHRRARTRRAGIAGLSRMRRAA